MSEAVKYPRTLHLPWSPGRTRDDLAHDVYTYTGEVVVNEKMDGENCNLYHGRLHARSLTFSPHPSRDWVTSFWASIRHDIPEGMRICGENLYARHSIAYDDLPSYFLGFSVWEGDWCLPWNETLEWFELLGIEPVPTLYRGVMPIQGEIVFREGYVVRPTEGFSMEEFRRVVGKYVRANHVQTGKHWMSGPVVPNGLRGKSV